MADTGEINIVQDVDGGLYLEPGTEPPAFVTFSPQLIAMIRRSGSLWVDIDGDTIIIRIKPEPLYYRLTGEADGWGGLVAQRMTADGRVW